MRYIVKFFFNVALFLTFLLSNLSFGDKPPAYFIDESKLEFFALEDPPEPGPPLPSTTRYWGVHKGAGYRIEVPDNWNGDLVMYAHGNRGLNLELLVSSPNLIRRTLITEGYAWAASSFSRNDYDVATGVQDTHALAKYFNGLVGKPNRTYIFGVSMGGHITAVSVEQYRNTYDGALAACGVLADYEHFDYNLDVTLAAQQIGTGSSIFPVDPDVYLNDTIPDIKGNLEYSPGDWPGFLNSDGLNSDGVNFKNLVELRSGGVRPIFEEAWQHWNGRTDFLLRRGIRLPTGTIVRSPGMALDNAYVTYQFDTDPALTPDEEYLNEDIFRVTYDPQGRHPNGLAQMPPVTGNITVPVLTIHSLGDLFVPVHNEIIYAERVADQGRSDLLVQRAIRSVGHCGINSTEYITSFLDLVEWVENGTKPDGDDFLDPEKVADTDFGCQFTEGDHRYFDNNKYNSNTYPWVTIAPCD